MSLVVKVANSICTYVLQRRLFKSLLRELEATYGDLLLHANVGWVSLGKVLQRIVDLWPEIRQFLSTRNNDNYLEVSNNAWLLDHGFLTWHLTVKFNALNSDLQGRERDLWHILSSVNSYKAKVRMWNSQLQNKRFVPFSNLGKNVAAHWQPEGYCKYCNPLFSQGIKRQERTHLCMCALMYRPMFQFVAFSVYFCVHIINLWKFCVL